MTLKKLYSAPRKVARARISRSIEVVRHNIPGEGDNLQEVLRRALVRGGGVKDLLGVRYKVVRVRSTPRGVSDVEGAPAVRREEETELTPSARRSC